MTIGLALSPRLMIAAASTFVAALDVARRTGPMHWADALARHLGVAPGERWDVALLQHCGFWSHYDHHEDRSSWPIGHATVPDELAEYGRTRGLLRDDPKDGDLFLQSSPSKVRFARAGLVVRVVRCRRWSPDRGYVDLLSIEGNTGDAGEFGGANVRRVARRLSASSGDRFLRWADANPGYMKALNPVVL